MKIKNTICYQVVVNATNTLSDEKRVFRSYILKNKPEECDIIDWINKIFNEDLGTLKEFNFDVPWNFKIIELRIKNNIMDE